MTHTPFARRSFDRPGRPNSAGTGDGCWRRPAIPAVLEGSHGERVAGRADLVVVGRVEAVGRRGDGRRAIGVAAAGHHGEEQRVVLGEQRSWRDRLEVDPAVNRAEHRCERRAERLGVERRGGAAVEVLLEVAEAGAGGRQARSGARAVAAERAHRRRQRPVGGGHAQLRRRHAARATQRQRLDEVPGGAAHQLDPAAQQRAHCLRVAGDRCAADEHELYVALRRVDQTAVRLKEKETKRRWRGETPLGLREDSALAAKRP